MNELQQLNGSPLYEMGPDLELCPNQTQLNSPPLSSLVRNGDSKFATSLNPLASSHTQGVCQLLQESCQAAVKAFSEPQALMTLASTYQRVPHCGSDSQCGGPSRPQTPKT